MKTNVPNFIDNKVVRERLNVLMSIQNFENDLNRAIENISETTNQLIRRYEEGLNFLTQINKLDLSERKREMENLNGMRVHSNQMIHSLELIETSDDENVKMSEQISIFEQKQKRMSEYALRFENLGSNILKGDLLQTWKDRYCVYQKDYAEKFEKSKKKLVLINQFYEKYSPEEIELISNIIAENRENYSESADAENFKIQYLKAISQYKQEFNPTNLWDRFLNILAGGVHPTPEEKVMLTNWMDGKQKKKPYEKD